MAEPTPEQKIAIEQALKDAQAKFTGTNAVVVQVTGNGIVTSSNPRFQIEHRKD